MNTNIQPKYGDALHDALSCLGNLLLDRKPIDKHDMEELGCLLLVLADYAYLNYHMTNE